MKTETEIKNLIASLSGKRPGLHFDISGTSVENQTVKVKETESFDQNASQRTSATLRVWNSDGRVGVVQLTSLEQQELLTALDVALEAAALGPSDHLPQVPSPRDAGALPNRTVGANPRRVSIEDLGTELLKGVRQLKSSHPKITGVPYNAISQRRAENFYANTEGLVRCQEGTSVSTYLYALGQVDGFKPRAAGHWGAEISLDNLKISDVAEKASELLVSHLNPVKIPSGQYPIVFSGQAFLDLLGAFSNLFSAQNILDKQSLHTRESLGQLVANPLLSVVDDPLHDSHVSPDLFDGEGTAVRKLTLIEQGVLKGLWHHSVSAKLFDSQKTGHARVGAKMTVGPWFLTVAPGAGLGAFADDCVWVDELEALHAGVNSLQGSFSLPFLGYRIQGGKKQSLDGVTVAGDILTLLKSIVAVDSSQQRASSGVCPAVAISSLSVTCEG